MEKPRAGGTFVSCLDLYNTVYTLANLNMQSVKKKRMKINPENGNNTT